MRVAVGATTLRGRGVGPILLLPNESFPQQVNDRLAIVLDVSVCNFSSQPFPGFFGRQQVGQEEIVKGGRDVDGLTNPDGVAVGRRHIIGAKEGYISCHEGAIDGGRGGDVHVWDEVQVRVQSPSHADVSMYIISLRGECLVSPGFGRLPETGQVLRH